MLNGLFESIGRALVNYLTTEIEGFAPLTTTADPVRLASTLQVGDVLLVEGRTRISSAIKYLTQSTWSHAALYVGDLGIREGDAEPHVLVEVNLGEGCISAPLSRYALAHTRICRPVGLSAGEAVRLAQFMIERIGLEYDMRNIVDLVRYLLPTPPVPTRFRRRMIALGSGDPTRAICSTLIAAAFQEINYPVLPCVTRSSGADYSGNAQATEVFHIRHHSLYTPRDFDLSPYFAIIKPTIEAGFDYHGLVWDHGNSRALPKG